MGCGSSSWQGRAKVVGRNPTRGRAYVATSFMVFLKQTARARQSAATAAVRPSFRCNTQRYTPDCELGAASWLTHFFALPAEGGPAACRIFFLFRVSVKVRWEAFLWPFELRAWKTRDKS